MATLLVALAVSVGARTQADEPPAGLSQDDWHQIRDAARASEYDPARVVEPGATPSFVAPNPAQGYRTTFRRSGAEIVPKAPAGASWRLGVSAAACGFRGDLRPLPPVEPRVERGRVEYRRGPVTEWYVNKPGGLEQGFTIAEPATRVSEPIVLVMAIEGGLEVRIEDEGAASFRDGAGHVRVRYQGLAAWDADGRTLPSRLDASDRQLRVLVEVGEARFPVTVDPTFLQEAKLEGHSESAGAQAGWSVSVAGDTAVVGAWLDDAATALNAGSAYVFVRSGAAWSLQQKLVAPNGAANDYFGFSVAVSGDTAVVGAPGEDTGSGAGSAYVFVRSGTVWSQQQKLVSSDGFAGDFFGESVSVSGDIAMVGAPLNNSAGAFNAGSAYVFVRTGAVWSEEQELLDPSPATYDFFGGAVSVSGDTAVIGARRHDTAGGAHAGSAYVFVRSGTLWSQQQELVASDGAADDAFATSVALSGDTAVVGAPRDDMLTGSAYVFVRLGTSWSQQQKLVASDGGDTYFGESVAVSGDTAVVGATLGGSGLTGSAYVFARSGTLWGEQQKLVASDAAFSDAFGSSVSISGDTALVGAPWDDTASGLDAGSAYVFVRSGTAWSEEQKLVAPDDSAGDRFGSAVSVSGDTAVVGAPRDATDAGSAYVFVRSQGTWYEQQKLVAPDGTAGDQFGISVSVSGDTTLVGAWSDDTAGGQDAGSAYVFVRSGAAWSLVQQLFASDQAPGAAFGAAVSVSGDTAVVSAVHGNTTAPNAGSAYVFVRSGAVWNEQQKLQASDAAAGDAFGSSLSVVGDTAVVGADGADTVGGPDAGAAYVFVRSGTVWAQQQKLVASDGAGLDGFGHSVSAFSDTAVVGALGHDTAAGVDAGSAYVFARSGAVWSEQQELVASDGAASASFGSSVSISGTTTVIGAFQDSTGGGLAAGSAYVFKKLGSTWTEEGKLLASDGAANDLLGLSVSLSGETAVVGAPDDDAAGGPDAGSAYVFRVGLADLSVTKTDGQASAAPGQVVTYTIVATNAGPDPVTGAPLWDGLPPDLVNATWTCLASPGAACTVSGNGSINDSVTLPVAGTVTYSLTATIDPAATGSVYNLAGVFSPVGGNDPDLGNNYAADSDALLPPANLRVTKTDGQSRATPGGSIIYSIVASNAGPSDALGATVVDLFPASITGVTWACTPSGGASCGGGGGSGDISRVVDLPAGGAVTFVASGTVDPGATGTLVNTATVTAPADVADPEPSDNTATDVDNLTLTGLSELTHGMARVRSLESTGPGTPANLFRLRQEPRSSYEVVVDGVTGDIASPAGTGPLLRRLAGDASTVLQTAEAAGVGSSRSLRFENASAAAREDEFVSVQSDGCTTTCGPEDVYRIRAWDTTLRVPRFNNSGTQVTILVLQNTTGRMVGGHAHFWSTAGDLAASQAFSLGPGTSLVVNTSALAGVASLAGSITVSHDGPYGALAGKAVAIEPATGFAFDTPLEPRSR